MHGHGEKPHMCTFPECDRSIPGNGFPRRWNLFDHMKRVHDYTGPASSSSSSSSSSPTPSSTGSFQANTATLTIRKRRPSSPSQAEPLKRTKSNTGNTQPAPKVTKASATTKTTMPSQNRPQSMQTMWLDQKAAIKARLDSLEPHDAGASEQIRADCAILSTIGMNIRRQQASQLASTS